MRVYEYVFRVYMHVFMYTCVYTCMCVYMCLNVYVHVCALSYLIRYLKLTGMYNRHRPMNTTHSAPSTSKEHWLGLAGGQEDYAGTGASEGICMCVAASLLAFGSCWAPVFCSGDAASSLTVRALPVMGWGGDLGSKWRASAEPRVAEYLAGPRQQVQLHIGIRQAIGIHGLQSLKEEAVAQDC